ncbi:MAG: tRNA 2-selenouridine synthase [Bacteroidetes bacterium]|nr:tRNA 2-selenouridine synthase [Bacteroidota bacterium]
MPASVHINEFLKLSETYPILDVRTPAEFEHGHIPGAVNIPLFDNEERKTIGTLYKQEGKQPAILKGLELVGPKMHRFISDVMKIPNTGTFLFHCWRGGMRSSSMAWLFETYGFKCITLKGGYKQFRNHVLKSFAEQKEIIVVGGKTGSGKTLILHELQKQGEQIIDLEQLAHHKGSSFGAFGEEKQLTQEQFENNLATAFSKIDPAKKCWLEDESRKIGINVLPAGLWEQMRAAKVICIDLPLEERVNYLIKEYGKFSKAELIAATQRITRHLGHLQAKVAVDAIEEGDLATACSISLNYYDKTYSFGLDKREKEKIVHCEFEKLAPGVIAEAIRKM